MGVPTAEEYLHSLSHRVDWLQHPDAQENPHWVPPWYDLPLDEWGTRADGRTHNPWRIHDSSTKQTSMELWYNTQIRTPQEERRRRIIWAIAVIRTVIAGLDT